MSRVVHLVGSLGLGGGERTLVDLAVHGDRTRYEHHVVALYEGGEHLTTLQESGVPVQVLGVSPGPSPQSWIIIRRKVRALRPQIAHAHMPPAIRYGLSAALSAGVRVRLGHVQNTKWNRSRKQRLAERASSRFAQRLVACSEAVSNFYQHDVGYPASKLVVAHNAVDLARFKQLPARDEARQRSKLPLNAPILVSVGSLIRQKGFSHLLQAIEIVQRIQPDIILLVVGDGPQRAALERQVHSLGIEGSVRFLGQRLDVPAVMAAADLFVLASQWEGFGIVLAEAGAAGLPSVATRVGGIPEIVQDGETGLLVPPRDPAAMANAVAALLAADQTRAEIGERARRRVESRFSVGRLTRQVEGLYEELLAARGPEQRGGCSCTFDGSPDGHRVT